MTRKEVLESGARLRIALINTRNPKKNYSINKDLNGGLGTGSSLGNSLTSRILERIRRHSFRIPVPAMAYLQAIFVDQEHQVFCLEDQTLEEECDLILLYGSMVDYKYENELSRQLKRRFPRSRIGFHGPFPSRFPEYYPDSDFVLIGEAEAFFMNEFKDLAQLEGSVLVGSLTDMDELPSPNFNNLPVEEYSYVPANRHKNFVAMYSSKGCPYSCRFYCTYGEYQGSKIRQRSAKRVVDDMHALHDRYGVRAIQFRDPVFGLKVGFIRDFCSELRRRPVAIKWGVETRVDVVSKRDLQEMFDVGLRNINFGIETSDKEVAAGSQRLLVEDDAQEDTVAFCAAIGVKVSAFYIIGLEGDSEETIKKTIRYAKRLNTFLVRFSVATPYPGTKFYESLESQGRLLTTDYEEYTQFELVYDHGHLSRESGKKWLERAYRAYYFRPRYVIDYIGWKLREYWL